MTSGCGRCGPKVKFRDFALSHVASRRSTKLLFEMISSVSTVSQSTSHYALCRHLRRTLPDIEQQTLCVVVAFLLDSGVQMQDHTHEIGEGKIHLTQASSQLIPLQCDKWFVRTPNRAMPLVWIISDFSERPEKPMMTPTSIRTLLNCYSVVLQATRNKSWSS